MTSKKISFISHAFQLKRNINSYNISRCIFVLADFLHCTSLNPPICHFYTVLEKTAHAQALQLCVYHSIAKRINLFLIKK